MAKVLGQSGRYVSDEAVRQRRQLLLIVFIIVAICGAIEGFLLSLYFRPAGFSQYVKIPVLAAMVLLIVFLWKWGDRKLDDLEKKSRNFERGARGEGVVADVLATLPDDFCVINGLTTPFGDLDHVVVGPTGVFVLDAKNWRGVVSADGKGELLRNGKPTSKPEIKQFTGRMMGIRDKVRLLATGLDPFYNDVFVFTSAWVDAKFGQTKNVNCITDDRLRSYIIEKDFGKRLSKDEVERIAQAFLGLAHMDAQFTRGAAPS